MRLDCHERIRDVDGVPEYLTRGFFYYVNMVSCKAALVIELCEVRERGDTILLRVLLLSLRLLYRVKLTSS